MANLAISAAGAVVGYMVGGPTGAQLGWMAGSAYAASRNPVDQRQVANLHVQTAQWGEPIPFVFGLQRITGNIIWASEMKPYTITTRPGKGGQKVLTNGYKIDLAIGLCAGPIFGISKVWANEKLIIDSSVEAKPLVGELYLGDMLQEPDPTMVAALGAGNVPAYRGLAYIVLSDFDVTSYGAVVPQFSFEIARGGSI
jgi:hypothetical protein